MSDSDYIPNKEKHTVKTTKPRKLAKPTTKDSFSDEERYTVKTTKTRKITKPSTLKDASNVMVIDSSDEEKYGAKATKTRKPTKTTTLKETSNIMVLDSSSDEEDDEKYTVNPTKSRQQPKQPTLTTPKNTLNVLDSDYSSDEEEYTVKPTKSRQQLKQTTLTTLKDTSNVLDSDYSLDEEQYAVKPTKSRQQLKQTTLTAFKDTSNVLDSDYSPDEEQYTAKPTKSRQQLKQTTLTTLTTLKDTSNVLDSDYSLDEDEYTIKPTKIRKPTVKKASSSKAPSSKASSSKTSSSKASSSKVTSSEASYNKAASNETSSNNVTSANSSSNGASTQSKKPVEEVYQKKTQLEHILLRPDTYVGSVQASTEKLWVYDSDKRTMVYREITYVPGLYKIIDEILVNAADNKIRDPSMDTIKVDIDVESGKISIYNNGNGIPIEIHKEENVYVPELIFGHLLTSSNYNDNEKKVTGGRNGYGAKLTNIFSTEFIVETVDSSAGKKYRQVFKDNMSVKEPPKISSYSKKEEYTMITFKPDFQKFNMFNEFDNDIVALLKKRVYDLAGCVRNVKVFLNGERLKIKNFKEYSQMYLSGNNDFVDLQSSIIYEEVNQRWEIAFVPSPEGTFQQISFVNSISTSKGGTHVNYVADQIVEKFMAAVTKKAKDVKNIKKHQIKNHMWLFINCLIENATFDSQTKECLTLKASSFGSKCNPSETYFNKLLKSNVIESILDDVKHKQSKELKKTDGRKTGRIMGIAKLDDANNAGGKKCQDCTLILTEGDSAKALAVAGFSIVGRDNYGVFPLRGKLLNVRDGTHNQIMNNAEIQHIKQILGLKQGKVYTSTGELRYGHLMIMTDQDHDGSHIKGLIINFLDYFFPSLLKVPGFLMEFITPIVKCTRGNTKKSFFTLPEFASWLENNDNGKGWKIKYYKGLGTSTAEEAKEYFKDLRTHKKPFKTIQEGERELIDMAFNKKKADDRKEWLRNYEPGTYMNHNVKEITITDFINKELILFSRADNERSIPSVLDGFKPGQRKVLYTCIKNKYKNEIKVSALAGAVLADAAYHHGDSSLQGTIIAMAHDFVGSNNISILHGVGQFGTRSQGGKDAASARYISIAVPKLARMLFHPQDDVLLTYCNDDGQIVEPEWYLPIIPMILVNGSEGIGTGWSTYIPNYNPQDIVNNLKLMIDGKEPVPMHPWYRGFRGSTEQAGKDKYKVSGIIELVNNGTEVRITELPVRSWTQNYKEQLEQWISGTEKVPAWIIGYKENHTITNVDFTVQLTEEKLNNALEEGLEKKFKLSTNINTSNMVCFDGKGRIKKYSSAEEILLEFYDYRLEYYFKRKDHMLKVLELEVNQLRNKARFIQMKIEHKLEFEGFRKAEIIKLLESEGFERFRNAKEEKSDDEDQTDNGGDGYNYLMNTKSWSFCKEEAQKLMDKKTEKEKELAILRKKSPQEIWEEDLDVFLDEWNELLNSDRKR
ncbi:DNA topoisomerase 2 [Rhizophagus irregularis DAOM 197198w]|uniref:DNA topoisomerase 2 n=1 Tax=Rhizophagus irregularis (strain DAOM 197198w) TaxID=1432141 RepID=A0A015LQG0_RHIIW|nr:DNA topoisomerase 2 [Rhizophagus irregularis DAOM 197198w]